MERRVERVLDVRRAHCLERARGNLREALCELLLVHHGVRAHGAVVVEGATGPAALRVTHQTRTSVGLEGNEGSDGLE